MRRTDRPHNTSDFDFLYYYARLNSYFDHLPLQGPKEEQNYLLFPHTLPTLLCIFYLRVHLIISTYLPTYLPSHTKDSQLQTNTTNNNSIKRKYYMHSRNSSSAVLQYSSISPEDTINSLSGALTTSQQSSSRLHSRNTLGIVYSQS